MSPPWLLYPSSPTIPHPALFPCSHLFTPEHSHVPLCLPYASLRIGVKAGLAVSLPLSQKFMCHFPITLLPCLPVRPCAHRCRPVHAASCPCLHPYSELPPSHHTPAMSPCAPLCRPHRVPVTGQPLHHGAATGPKHQQHEQLSVNLPHSKRRQQHCGQRQRAALRAAVPASPLAADHVGRVEVGGGTWPPGAALRQAL